MNAILLFMFDVGARQHLLLYAKVGNQFLKFINIKKAAASHICVGDPYMLWLLANNLK